MNSLTRIMSYDKTKINQEYNCGECTNIEIENQTVEYPKLSEEEIEQIINERYFNKDEKTKTFIRKALRKHGDRYDYSNVVYVRTDEKVEIICRIEGHEPFPQTPNNHLNGRGCSKCGGNKKLTTEEFIEKANEKHGLGRYDYSKVKYKNWETEVIIICPNHDKPYEFKQTPNAHLQGQGCKICGIKKRGNELRMSLEEFIEKANFVQGEGRYDYSKVNYINYVTEVIIICPNHNEPYEFPQKPRDHLRGEGCPKCGGNKKLTTEEFIEKANEIYGKGRYDYSKVNYVNMNTEVIIICPNHEEPYEFKRTPCNHLVNSGCPLCNETLGESKIRLFLINNNIEFEREKIFKDCRYKNPLRFDFYLPQYDICIEFDGGQHIKKVNWNGKYTNEQLEERLEVYKLRDQIKNDYCKSHNITLLRFNNLKTIEGELTQYFCKSIDNF